MTKIKFIHPDGTEQVVDASNGHSLMETALDHSIPGVIAECNGSAACATCHVVLPEEIMGLLNPISEHENDMLDFANSPRQPGSRLGCQIVVSDALDNVTVRVPAA